MRIKGWRKGTENALGVMWISNTIPETWLSIIKKEYKPQYLKYWDVEFGMRGSSGVVQQERFDTKDEALKFAIDYMKKHPKGWVYE